MSVGLDLGSSQIRCLRQRGDRLIGGACRAVFAALPDAPEFRELLASGHIPFAVCEGALALVGDTAQAYSSLFHVRPQSLLPQGHLPTNDPVARQCTAALVEALLGVPDHPGEICCVTLPGGELSRSIATSNELEFFSRLIRLRGFVPQVLSSGMAIVLSHLVRNSFTGIGLSFGAATSELVLAHRGLEIAMCSSPRGAEWLDERLAESLGLTFCDSNGATCLNIEEASQLRQEFPGSLATPTDPVTQIVADVHHDLVYATIRSAALELVKHPRALDLPQPLPIVIIGGTARIRGFQSIVSRAFAEAQFPLAISEIQLATDDDFTVARGCLINAQLESEVRAEMSRAA